MAICLRTSSSETWSKRERNSLAFRALDQRVVVVCVSFFYYAVSVGCVRNVNISTECIIVNKILSRDVYIYHSLSVTTCFRYLRFSRSLSYRKFIDNSLIAIQRNRFSFFLLISAISFSLKGNFVILIRSFRKLLNYDYLKFDVAKFTD